jgi:hypothetical protein
MNPGALVTNVGHFEKIRVQPDLSNSILKKGLMGSWGARCHHYPVQAMLLDNPLNLLLGILGTGIEVILYVNHLGKALGILRHIRDIHHATNVDPTMAYENANARPLISYVNFGAIFSA